MPRRGQIEDRPVEPDPKYSSHNVARFINKLMERGKKSVATRIVYDAFLIMEERTKKPPTQVFEQAVKNATPMVEVKPRRVGGATYPVPVEIRSGRRLALAMRWLIASARSRPGKSMAEKLAAEFIDASNGQGRTIKKKEDTHRMAEANKAFSHYRW